MKYHIIIFLLITLALPVLGQDTITVTGKIVAGKNNPLENVSVSVEGSDSSPVLTDEEGRFVLEAPENSWLIIQPIGRYKGKRVFLDERIEMRIVLSGENMKSGNDQVQLLYEKKSRRNILTSYAEVDAEAARKKNIQTADQAFSEAGPGIYSTSMSGMPGQGTFTFIHGISATNTSQSPLYILDGTPLETPGLFESRITGNSYNPLTTIDPNDISRITILKGPGPAAIYGSRASNGVILIETLEPTALETSIKFSMQTGINFSPDRLIPQLNNDQYRSFANEILFSSSILEESFEEYYPGLYIEEGEKDYYRYMHNTKWQEMIFSNALMANAHLSVQGGSEIATYGLSVGYHDQEGVFKNSDYNRFNVLFVSHLNVYSWLKVDLNTQLVNVNSSPKASAVSPETSPIRSSLSKSPIMGPYRYNDDGVQLSIFDDLDELGVSNPAALIENYIGENKNYRFLSNIKAHAEISESLKWTSLFGLNFNTMKEFVFMPNIGMDSYFDGEANNVAQSTNNYLFSIYNDNYLSFRKQIGTEHDISSFLGFRINTNRMEVDFGQALNLPENDQYSRLQAGKNELRLIGGDNQRWNWLSVYNAINYSYKDKYFLGTGFSFDFSSRTGKEAETTINLFNMPLGLFYSVDAGWRISEEAFLWDVSGLDNLMLRLSYGTSGNNDIGNANALSYYQQVLYRETTGLIPEFSTNLGLRYEKTSQVNAGFDLAFSGSRTNISLDYFSLLTSDLLLYEPQESYSGFEFRPVNAGEVRNSGFEIALFQRLIDGSKFDWDANLNLTFHTNIVVDMQNNEFLTPFEGGEFITQEGFPVNSFYGYQYEGVFADWEEADAAGLVNAKGIPFGAGDAIYRDVSGPDNEPDQVINNYDKVYLGSPIPTSYGNFSTRLQYNRWNLDMLIDFTYGNEIFNYVRYVNERMVDLSNQSNHVISRWQREGDVTDVPRALWNDPVGNSAFSSRWIEDGSFIRLKQVRLGYVITDVFWFIKNAEFYISASNLITLDRYLGYHPEFSYSFNSMHQGIDYGLMPQYRQFMLGIQIGL